MLVVIDLDGTLCNVEHRLHKLERKSKLDRPDWDAFNIACSLDEPYYDVLNLIHTLYKAGDRVILLTGRDERYRRVTEMWLQYHGLGGRYLQLLMRPKGNIGSDADVKPLVLARFLKESEWDGIDFILEDRYKMVEKWRDLGYDCWQVRQGAY